MQGTESEGWRTLHAARIQKSEHITRTEGRALVWSVCHRHRSFHATPHRMLFLVDNMALCLAINKGRSGSPLLASTASFIAAVAIATTDVNTTEDVTA